MRYSKHHGLGNDFLVLLTDWLPLDAAERAAELCDRHTGVGADGLIIGIHQLDGSVAMRLRNSDGSLAEVLAPFSWWESKRPCRPCWIASPTAP